MLAVYALLLAVASLGLSAALALRLRAVERALQKPSPAAQPVLAPPHKPLEGLRIALAIEQDHPHPVFVTLLKELLLREEAELVEGADCDLTISGHLVGNGYADVYYTAELVCFTSGGPLFTLLERPPHGDRPGNLALELVTRLKREIEKSVIRNERRTALKELRD